MRRTVSASAGLMTSVRSLASYPSGTLPPIHMPFFFEAAILSRMRSPVTSRSNWAKDNKSNMGLPRAAVADRDHVLSARDVLAAGKLQHHCLVERRDRREIETVQALDRRKPRLLDAALDHPLLPVDQFELGQAQQITRVVDAFGSALLGKLVVFAQEARQPECLQVMGEQQLGRVAHDETPVRRSR